MTMSSASNIRTVLHVITKPDDGTVAGIVGTQQKQPLLQIKVADLTVPEPDYKKLLEDIFAADAVAVW
jgi:hypothetical protein